MGWRATWDKKKHGPGSRGGNSKQEEKNDEDWSIDELCGKECFALLLLQDGSGRGNKQEKSTRKNKNDTGKKHKRVSRRVLNQRVQIKNVSVQVCATDQNTRCLRVEQKIA